MKKIVVLIIFIFLTSCDENKKFSQTVDETSSEICKSSYKIGTPNKQSLQLKGVVVSDDVKIVSSPMVGTVNYLNCNAGKKIYPKTLIAKIKPDTNNPNVVNLNIQKGSLINQKTNLVGVKSSTISNFDTQIVGVDKQMLSIKEQRNILKNNKKLTKKSSSLGQKDIQKQGETLENTLNGLKNNVLSLQKNLELSKVSEKEALAKVDISKKTLLSNIFTLSSDNLLKIDETFGISFGNKKLNDKYEDYLGKKDSVLLKEVKDLFRTVKSRDISNSSDKEISQYLGDIIFLNNKAQDSIKASIENIYFSRTQIDSFYKVFLTYGNSITEIKNNWDSLDNSKDSIRTNYATAISNLESQITSLETQISSTQTNKENLETNKMGSTQVSLDLQLSSIDAQIKTLDSNLENLVSQRANLVSTKKTQILNLDNQILQLNQNIASLSTNLSQRNVYANISGTVKQKVSATGNNVGINNPLCQIIPNTKSTRIKIYSPIELDLGDKFTFIFNKEPYEIRIENILVYKDPVTQNYVYESNYLDKKYFKDGEVLNLDFSGDTDKKTGNPQGAPLHNITLPVGYIKNRIDGNFVAVHSGSIVTEQKVELGDINGSIVEVTKGLNGTEEICR